MERVPHEMESTSLLGLPSSCFPSLQPSSEDEGPQEPLQERLYCRAAKIIQRTWRRRADTHVFKNMTRLISHHNQGDPRLLLKAVNPREGSITAEDRNRIRVGTVTGLSLELIREQRTRRKAELLDAGSGVFVRLRLGGITFPPNIYYKIFTHRPVVDMCANSPKDYTHPGHKKPVARQTNNGWALVQEDRSGWYRRIENNGWRLFVGTVAPLGELVDDGATRKMDFHYSKLQRQQDMEKKRKRRKIEWMKHMYNQGRLQARTEQQDVATLVQNTARGMMHAVEEQEDDQIMEWEVDELLAWTNALNFEEYMQEWRMLAVSRSSEPRKDPCGSSGPVASRLQ